jgi:hypothetical protein
MWIKLLVGRRQRALVNVAPQEAAQATVQAGAALLVPLDRLTRSDCRLIQGADRCTFIFAVPDKLLFTLGGRSSECRQLVLASVGVG